MSLRHTIVWLDHHNAKVIDFSFDNKHVVDVHYEGDDRKLHHKVNTIGSGHKPEDPQYFAEIVAALDGAHEVLITGPGTAKIAFKKHVDKTAAQLAKCVVGVETLDHPSEGELLAYARKFFKAYDQLNGDVI
jgi:stalled ribosome rescue protein Dom34